MKYIVFIIMIVYKYVYNIEYICCHYLYWEDLLDFEMGELILGELAFNMFILFKEL